ncbi:MAG: hydantoinase/oxoprolinase N-terminal domain-containing protein [Solirubrobacterales bacterium]
MQHIGVDVGGTFTDIFTMGEHGVAIHKVPSTPHDPSIATVEGMREACEKQGSSLADLALVFHGTTVATNTVIQRTGSKVALLTTEGFRDILHIARHKKPLNWPAAAAALAGPAAGRALAAADRAREQVTGPEEKMLQPLEDEDVREAAQVMRSAGVEAVSSASCTPI